MDELDVKKNILLKNKNHILRMPNNKKKVDLIKAYFSLLHYYETVADIDEADEELDIDAEFIGKYDRYLFNDTARRIDEFEVNAPILCDKYQQIIDTYKDNEFCEYEYIAPIKVNRKIMSAELWNFFSSLGDDVLRIYHNMIMGQNIFLNNGDMERFGYAVDSTPIDYPCILVQNVPNYLDFYVTLAHEVGHCYQFYLQKNQRHYGVFDPYCEITSILFEKLFLEYLKDNYVIKNMSSVDLESHMSFLRNTCISKAVCKLFAEDKIGLIDPYTLSYSCFATEDEIKKEITDDFGYIKPYHIDPELSEVYYSFGNIIATHFVKELKEDFDSGWKNFKNFICTMGYLPMEEVIVEYFDIDLIKENAKKLIKSYHER